MAESCCRVRITDEGQITLPVEWLRKYDLRPGAEVSIEDTGVGVLVLPQNWEDVSTKPDRPRFRDLPPTPEELALRRAAFDRILAHRAQMPSIAPLTTAALVHMGRDDSFWYGEEEPTNNGTGE